MSPGDEELGRQDGAKRDGRTSFEKWRRDFFADANARGLLYNAQSIGDFALQLFWERGVPPTVDAVIASGEEVSLKPRPKRAC
jgi:hypothetical protein